jgi:cell division protein FtsL
MNEYVREYVKIESRARRRGNFALTYGPWVLLLAAASIFGRVWTQTQAVRLVEELTRLKQEERELTLAQDDHERALVRLSTRERIAQVARESLRMDYPAEGEVVFLPVAASPEPPEAEDPRHAALSERGLADFLKAQLRGAVNREAYALSTM